MLGSILGCLDCSQDLGSLPDVKITPRIIPRMSRFLDVGITPRVSGSLPGCRDHCQDHSWDLGSGITPGLWEERAAPLGVEFWGSFPDVSNHLGKKIFFRRMLHLLGCPVNLKERGDLRRKSRILRRMLWGLVASRRFPSLQFPVGRGAKAVSPGMPAALPPSPASSRGKIGGKKRNSPPKLL